MPGKRVTPVQKRKFASLLEAGWTHAEACRQTGFSSQTGYSIRRGMRSNSGAEYKRSASVDTEEMPHPRPFDELCDEARRALDDFGYFRRIYLGRVSTPWQEEGAHKVKGYLETQRKEYLVTNEPPGVGKSTTFVLDIPLWLTCLYRSRGKRLRGMIGSATEGLASTYLLNLRAYLESPVPIAPDDDEIAAGLAYMPERNMLEDFGYFKPLNPAVWSAKAFTIAQLGDRIVSHKERTWSAFGFDTQYIGLRVDVALWDDATSEDDTYTADRIDKKRARWDKVAEKRLEPGGLLVLQGQRLAPEDLYRHALDKQGGPDHDHGCCGAEAGRKYHHIVFPAHSDDRCQGDHTDKSLYYPDGCLLDPRRLPWHELEAEQTNDLSTYLTVYQQEDADPRSMLVHPMWLTGGIDPDTREVYPGCWDGRSFWELPPGVKSPIVAASTDPSPTKMWASECWAWDEETDLRFMLGLERRAMQLPDFLSWDGTVFSGLMENWWQESKNMGNPLTHWIIEQNAAQRFILQLDYFKKWASLRSVQLIAHTTHLNKTDPKYGPLMLGDLYRFGKKRLPGHDRQVVLRATDELTKWPKGRTDDTVMSDWMFEHNLHRLRRPTGKPHRQSRPKFMQRGRSKAAA